MAQPKINMIHWNGNLEEYSRCLSVLASILERREAVGMSFGRIYCLVSHGMVC